MQVCIYVISEKENMGRRGWLVGDGGGVIERFKKPSQPHNTPYIYILCMAIYPILTLFTSAII